MGDDYDVSELFPDEEEDLDVLEELERDAEEFVDAVDDVKRWLATKGKDADQERHQEVGYGVEDERQRRVASQAEHESTVKDIKEDEKPEGDGRHDLPPQVIGCQTPGCSGA